VRTPAARSPHEKVDGVSHDAIGAVTVFVDIMTSANGEPYRRHWMFSLPAGSRGMVVEITCSWHAGTPAQKRAEIDRIFNSLQILDGN
jgi:hypothetical protein